MSLLHLLLETEQNLLSVENSCPDPACTPFVPCVRCELIQGSVDLVGHAVCQVVVAVAPKELVLS